MLRSDGCSAIACGHSCNRSGKHRLRRFPAARHARYDRRVAAATADLRSVAAPWRSRRQAPRPDGVSAPNFPRVVPDGSAFGVDVRWSAADRARHPGRCRSSTELRDRPARELIMHKRNDRARPALLGQCEDVRIRRAKTSAGSPPAMRSRKGPDGPNVSAIGCCTLCSNSCEARWAARGDSRGKRGPILLPWSSSPSSFQSGSRPAVSRVLIPGVRKNNCSPPIACRRSPTGLRRHHPIDELLARVLLHLWMLRG